jgi:hypothetical protein
MFAPMKLLLLALLLTARLWAAPAPDFTIVALPDTQKYTEHRPDLFQSQVDWIIAQRTNLNIVYVAHLGDVVDDGDLDPAQWTVATNCLYRLLEAGIPLGVTAGNHDHDGGTKLFDQFFSPKLFAGRPWFGGHLGDNYRNHYDRFSVGNLDFIVLHLDFNYDKLDYRAADTWAPAVLASNANRRAIVVTHNVLNVKGEFDPRGKAVYDNLKSHTNLFLMVGGHNHAEAQRADTFNGHTIYSLLSDYQSWTNGGNGYLRLYRFSPAKNLIHVQSYSPAINHYRTDPTSEFAIPYRMNPDAPLPDLPPLETRFTLLNINAKPKETATQPAK